MSQLTKTERTWCITAFDTIYPGVDEGTAMPRAEVDQYVRDVCTTVPFKAFLGLRIATWLVALAPLFVLGRLATIRGLARAEREKLVARLASSRIYTIRQLVMILKAVGGMLYAARPAARARIMKPRGLTTPAAPLVALRLKRPQAA